MYFGICLGPKRHTVFYARTESILNGNGFKIKNTDLKNIQSFTLIDGQIRF